MCGGWNSKLPTAAAIWRQGHLLHFGFQESPEELNEIGRAMLENSIHYVARFTEDRPIGATVSPFSGRPRPERTIYLASVLRTEGITAEDFADRFFSGAAREELLGMGDEAASWARAHLVHLVPGEDGKLVLDADLQQLDVDVRAPGALAALRKGLDGPLATNAARALARRVPSGPSDGGPDAWTRYLDGEGQFLFFSDVAGCLFLVDPLAKARNVASAELRGPARADR